MKFSGRTILADRNDLQGDVVVLGSKRGSNHLQGE